MNPLRILWRFSRPHTIIGSFLSITALYLMACGITGNVSHFSIYIYALVSAFGTNVFIVGLNQIIDVDIDKINKPFLPLASGELSRKSAFTIIYLSIAISLLFGLLAGSLFFYLTILILTIGIAYSVPPIRLKNHHLPASLAITSVRGFLVNFGIGYFFLSALNDGEVNTVLIIPLTVFMMLFSIAIAWFKDLYDVDGDKQYNVKTLAVLYNIKTAFIVGNALVIIAFLFEIFYFSDKSIFLFYSHVILGISFILFILFSSIDSKDNIYKFYMTFWVFFFLEYLIYITDAVIKII